VLSRVTYISLGLVYMGKRAHFAHDERSLA
jgi:hypothetical protein